MIERREIQVSGLVQGVGFRPFVHELATRLGLCGEIVNVAGGVRIDIEGERGHVEELLETLRRAPPPLARVEQIKSRPLPPLARRDFLIRSSEGGAGGANPIVPDLATCPECLAELRDPAARRHDYPFTNCSHCGPRLTIITGAPYDRERTTMARFAMCPACRAEYESPTDRRFHAQPIACPECGPRLALLDAAGAPLDVANPLAAFAAELLAGRIGAIKGLGGYHLTCRADDSQTVAELRRRKRRDERALAIMVRDSAAAAALCEVSAAERQLLANPAAPIVLLRRRASSAGEICELVAPRGNPWLGVLLPYTPLHHLLMDAVLGTPLVMTSGNRTDEPIAHDDRDAVERLRDIADLFLSHDRPIRVRCDDSVTRVVAGGESLIRRSRGLAPAPLRLPVRCPAPTLAVGGQLKGTFALAEDDQAFVSHHLGDLDDLRAYDAMARDIELYEQLLGIRPECVVHDLHPDYATTRWAQELAERTGARRIEAQHHHAHLASCLVEHGLDEPAIGVIWDGAGLGLDGAVWGGEFLLGGLRDFQRAAHLRQVRLPGGDRAAREPWRMALSHALDAEVRDLPCPAEVDSTDRRVVEQMVTHGVRSPWTSSVGRLFDAVAALCGQRQFVHFEGQAAEELAWLADGEPLDSPYAFLLTSRDSAPLEVDTRPLVRDVIVDFRAGAHPRRIASRFHATLVELAASVCSRLRERTGLDLVALGGGVFNNALLAERIPARLSQDGFRCLLPRQVPPNDGGLSLGQLAIAAASMTREFSGE